jgi:hypothetical protein
MKMMMLKIIEIEKKDTMYKKSLINLNSNHCNFSFLAPLNFPSDDDADDDDQ